MEGGSQTISVFACEPERRLSRSSRVSSSWRVRMVRAGRGNRVRAGNRLRGQTLQVYKMI